MKQFIFKIIIKTTGEVAGTLIIPSEDSDCAYLVASAMVDYVRFKVEEMK
jgi:hypothetical protein